MTLTDEGLLAIRNAHEEEYGQYCDQDDFLMVARAIEARVLEELRKQEPIAWGVDWGTQGDRSCVSIIKKHSDGTMEVVGCEYSPAPIPTDNHDWKAEYLRQVDLHNITLDELREAEMQLRNPAPIPTPSQQEALDSLAGLLLGIELPQGKALAARQERACCLRDFILARPDTEGSKHE